MRRHILSFDAATKTFAFSLLDIDLDIFTAEFQTENAQICAILAKFVERDVNYLNEITAVARIAAAHAIKLYNSIIILDGETTDLCPNCNNNSITIIDRIRAFVSYADLRIRPILPAEFVVYLEHQMGPNIKSNIIATAIITYFARHEVHEVDARLKNCINFNRPYESYVQQYETLYAANKNHASDNLIKLSSLFNSKLPSMKHAQIGHIADSVMQVLATLKRVNITN